MVEDTAFRVCLVGRPNVGKSTLFNKMVGRAHAMVHPTPGLTRDWQASRASFAGREFTVIDSPGAEKQVLTLACCFGFFFTGSVGAVVVVGSEGRGGEGA